MQTVDLAGSGSIDQAFADPELSDIRSSYYNARSFDERMEALDSFEALDTPNGYLFSAGVGIELARMCTENQTQLSLLERAHGNLELVIDGPIKEPRILTPNQIAAAILRNTMPSYRALLLERRLLTVDEQVGTHEHTCALANVVNLAYVGQEYVPVMGEIHGLLAELSMIALFERFAIQHGEGQWSAMSSFFSEDYRAIKLHGKRRNWDISVFVNYAQQTEPSCLHRVQVKSRSSREEYTDDITVILVGKDLKTSESLIECNTILQEILEERVPGHRYFIPRVLDKRTSLAFDKIEETEERVIS
jgi:hypothetical protein